MKSRKVIKSVYPILAVVFMVLVLGIIAILSVLDNKNSDKLSGVVTQLSDNKYEIDRIDKAMQLLYKAENNSRLYVLTRDDQLYKTYVEQLDQVSSLIISVQKEDEQHIGGLVKDKKQKTELYIKAKLLADSLVRDLRSKPVLEPVPVVKPAPVIVGKITETPKSTTTINEVVVEKKSKRKLFGRIKDAITNKPQEEKIKNITTVEVQPSKTEKVTPVLPRTYKPIVKEQPSFSRLSEKEKSLLMANSALFNELQQLLGTLKADEIRIEQQRLKALESDAALLMNNLKSNTKYYLILSLILMAVILGALVLLYNNTKNLQKEKFKAEQNAKNKSEFVATLSHEMRTPLQSIHAFTDELVRGNTNAGDESEVVNAIKLSSNMLLAVVNNILDFTKMEEGKFRLNHIPFVPSSIIEEVILGLAIQAKRKNLSIANQTDNSAKQKVYGDAFQFRQVLINILSNAIKYTEKGSITVSANFKTLDHRTGTLEVCIEDTGIGISEDQLPTIFEQFNTQNQNAEIKEGSSGLGLSITKRIVDYQKGKIRVTSKVGIGTCFAFILPYDLYLDEAAIKSSAQKGSRNKVLLVENDPFNLKIMNLLLVNENYQVTSSMDGIAAFELYRGTDFDLVITDISIPGLNGFELTRKIRSLHVSEKSAVPILAISGHEKPANFANTGISAWLTKPYDARELLSTVEALCGTGSDGV